MKLAPLLLLLLVVGCAATLPKADRELFAAIKADDAAEIDRLLVSGAQVNVPHDAYFGGLPPLGWASVHGSTKAAESLLARGANVNGPDKHGSTPLLVAAYNQQPAVVALLLRHGANVDAPNDVGWTPLYKAMERLADAPATKPPPAADVAKVVSIVEALLASGARVEVPGARFATPIHLAALSGQKTLVQMLIDEGARVDATGNDGVTPLYQAARKDATEVAALLIAHGADVNVRTTGGKTPLMISAVEGNAQVAKLLLEHRAEVNARDKDGSSALVEACRSLLMRYTLEASTPGALDMRARSLRELSAAQATAELTKSRADLRQVKGQFGEVARLLVDGGADPNIAVPTLTPLGAAAVVGDQALAGALIAHGAKIDDTSTGESALHAAIAERHVELAALLVAKGANVNARNLSQLTPLHFLAANLHDRNLAELLIRHGADVNAKDQAGHTPLEGAMRAHNDEVTEVLRGHGAR
jgi:ankyrin repeat protein